MRQFRSHKVVHAEPITDCVQEERVEGEGPIWVMFGDGWRREISQQEYERIAKASEEAGHQLTDGWLVVYDRGTPDEWVSWSPPKAFEAGYSPVEAMPKAAGKHEISGYRNLSKLEVANINAVKEHANVIETLVETIMLLDDTDPRWCSIAKTHLQQGFMALVRAVARPEGF